jgi:hypothetical protein
MPTLSVSKNFLKSAWPRIELGTYLAAGRLASTIHATSLNKHFDTKKFAFVQRCCLMMFFKYRTLQERHSQSIVFFRELPNPIIPTYFYPTLAESLISDQKERRLFNCLNDFF